MSEKHLRKRVVELLHPLAGFSVENALSPGAPDVCCVVGWIELKLGYVRIHDNHVIQEVRPAQRAWHHKWRSRGGRSWFLTDVGGIWYLHDGMWGSKNLGETPYEAFQENCIFMLRKNERLMLVDFLTREVTRGWTNSSS